MSRLIAITGGIGSGKSVVSAILRVMGYYVYDCDSQAKRIMDTDRAIIGAIAAEISANAIRHDGSINRTALAHIVFNDADALARLNAIVHKAVRSHLSAWHSQSGGSEIRFVETAILYQSGIDHMVDEVWDVTAPDELRISRVMQRNGLTRTEVESRIASQAYTPEHPHTNVHHITNGYDDAILPQIIELLGYQKL